jgi:hypothetical protein
MQEGRPSTRSIAHYWIYYGSLSLLAIALPTSRFFITLSLILLIFNWVAEGHYGERFRAFYANKPALAFSSLYLFYLFSLIWSSNVNYALHNDLLHKSPTLFMPLILTTSQKLDARKIRLLLFFFIGSVFVATLIGLANRLLHPELHFREASPFMPMIYLGMMLVIAAFLLPVLVRQVSGKRVLFYGALLVSGWLIAFLFYLRVLSGITSFVVVSVYLLALFLKRLKSPWLKFLSLGAFILLAIAFFRPMKEIYRLTHAEIDTDFTLLESHTREGNTYAHDTTRIIRENGYLVYVNICDKELREEWNRRSDMDYSDDAVTGWELKHTLYRYMASRGLKKDREGMRALSDEDIRAVEKGVPNYLNLERHGVYKRIYAELMGLYIYRKSGFTDPMWGSLPSRLDLWRASLHAFREKPVLGWGIGSILPAVDFGFQKFGSPLEGLNMKPHSQYMYFLLTQGVVGLLLFFTIYVYLVKSTGAWRYHMFRVFVIMLAVYFIANNSIESQLGQNIFVFFTLIYCYFYPELFPSDSARAG